VIVEIVRASCDFLEAKISQNRKATVLHAPYGNCVISVRRPYDAAYDGFTRYGAYGESQEYNSALKATIHRTMCKNVQKISRQPYDSTATVRVPCKFDNSHRTAPVNHNRSICDWV